jgi:hypothetical protein
VHSIADCLEELKKLNIHSHNADHMSKNAHKQIEIISNVIETTSEMKSDTITPLIIKN